MLPFSLLQSADGYSSLMTLQVSNLETEDFGYYKCVALNSLGRDEKFIELKGKEKFHALDR